MRGYFEHEIFREPIQVSLYGLQENLGFDTIEIGQVTVQHDFVVTDKVDMSLNVLYR